MSCYKFIHLVTKNSSNPKGIKVIHKVAKTQGAVKKARWAHNKGKKYKVKLENALISVLPRLSPYLFYFFDVHLDSRIFVSRALVDKITTHMWITNASSCECEM
jgi:hypothetical protein